MKFSINIMPLVATSPFRHTSRFHITIMAAARYSALETIYRGLTRISLTFCGSGSPKTLTLLSILLSHCAVLSLEGRSVMRSLRYLSIYVFVSPLPAFEPVHCFHEI
jgi:hypothetical protein